MTELEQQLMSMLNQEREEIERERQESATERKALLSAIESLSEQNRQIIELLSKPTEHDSAEDTQEVLDIFQKSLLASLEQLLTKFSRGGGKEEAGGSLFHGK